MKPIPQMFHGLRIINGKVATWWSSAILWLRLRSYGCVVGHGLRVRGWVNLRIHPLADVRIGADCRMKSGFAENPAGGYRRLGIWVAKQAQLTIGDNVGLSNCTIMCAQAITIGNDVYIGGGSNIYDTDFHSIAPERRLARPDRTVKTAPILIGNRCFIGGHAIILKGVAIGDEAVVGAGAVVASNVPAREIWAGNPAKKIGEVV